MTGESVKYSIVGGSKMKFKIEMRDGTVIYANDICIYGITAKVSIWADSKEIDCICLVDVRWIWLLDPVCNICIFV